MTYVIRHRYTNEIIFEGDDLRKARLKDAYLVGADLRGADLEGGSLIGANLIGAELVKEFNKEIK